MAIDRNSYAVEVPRAGQHPFVPGSIRLSTMIAILVWMALCILVTTQLIEMTSRNLAGGLTIMAAGIGALWGGGVFLAKNNPYYQEVLIRCLIRVLRRRTNLET
jgi:hypothetical protein